MNKTTTNTATSYLRGIADPTSNLHQELLDKYSDADPTTETYPDALKLMSFNGYYSLEAVEDSCSGAFFSVDTNMVITKGSTTPIYHVSLIVSLDGKTSNIYHFKKDHGSFDGTHLKFNESGVVISLNFEHVNNDDFVTAAFEGTIQMPLKEEQMVTGKSYNNIIPMSMYAGSYYENVLGVFEDKMMEIGADFTLKYKGNGIGAQLTSIDSFVYNMNMYYFSFTHKSDTIKLIMGTSSGGGKVCNNMIIPSGDGANLQTRSLQTVTKTTTNPAGTPHSNSKSLASYSGFYPISSNTDSDVIKDGAFVSVEGIYQIDTSGSAPAYKVELGISLDGTTSTKYTIDSTMTFDGNTLAITNGADEIEMTFNRAYVPGSGSGNQFGTLASISGSINGTGFTGATALNPVPLKAFGGMTMTPETSSSETLEIISDTQLKYNGVEYSELLYVPIMYIVAFKSDKSGSPVVMLSLGTDGGRGTACIITDKGSTPSTTSVFAIPTGMSGQ